MDLGRGTGWVVFSQHYLIAFRPDPMRLEAGTPVALVMNVCTKDNEAAELVAVDAQPPDTVEGVRQHLTLVRGEAGRYRAEGLTFPAPGVWEIDFDVRSNGVAAERLSHEIIVK